MINKIQEQFEREKTKRDSDIRTMGLTKRTEIVEGELLGGKTDEKEVVMMHLSPKDYNGRVDSEDLLGVAIPRTDLERMIGKTIKITLTDSGFLYHMLNTKIECDELRMRYEFTHRHADLKYCGYHGQYLLETCQKTPLVGRTGFFER